MGETNIPQESAELSAEQLSELLQIRRDKLSRSRITARRSSHSMTRSKERKSALPAA